MPSSPLPTGGSAFEKGSVLPEVGEITLSASDPRDFSRPSCACRILEWPAQGSSSCRLDKNNSHEKAPVSGPLVANRIFASPLHILYFPKSSGERFSRNSAKLFLLQPIEIGHLCPEIHIPGLFDHLVIDEDRCADAQGDGDRVAGTGIDDDRHFRRVSSWILAKKVLFRRS